TFTPTVRDLAGTKDYCLIWVRWWYWYSCSLLCPTAIQLRTRHFPIFGLRYTPLPFSWSSRLSHSLVKDNSTLFGFTICFCLYVFSLRCCTSVFYAGLSIALGSLDFLFDIDLHSELFMDMFIVIAGLFNTWFFISGIPETFHDLDDVHEYPKGIKIFSQ